MKRNIKKFKKGLTKQERYDIILKLLLRAVRLLKEFEKLLEKHLTNEVKYDILKKLHKT